MIRHIADRVIAFDAEWVPDPETGRRVHRLPVSATDAEIRKAMWAAAGSSPENPRPFLKLVLCRVVSVAVVIREARDGPPALTLHSVPSPAEATLPESAIIERFLERGLGHQDAQLVGFNSSNSDLAILVQRGVAHGLRAPGFSRRPERPWEGRDYFYRHGDWNIDLMRVLGSTGRDIPSLDQMALAARIPGKIEVSGDQVLDLWLAGDVRKIVEYNQYDALTTYLLWLRVVHFAGLLTDAAYESEQAELERLLETRAAQDDGRHLGAYLDCWRTLRATP